MRAELLRVRGAPVLHLEELARLRGKLIHLAGTMAGRVGASLTYQCTYHITKDITTPSSALCREIDWVWLSLQGHHGGWYTFYVYASPECHCHL